MPDFPKQTRPVLTTQPDEISAGRRITAAFQAVAPVVVRVGWVHGCRFFFGEFHLNID